MLLISLFLLFCNFFHVLNACNDNKCVNQYISHPGDYVRCDMCYCDKLCSLNRDEELYNCYIKNDYPDSSCKVQLKTGWLAGFVIIGVLGFCCVCGGIGYLIYRGCCGRSSVGAK